MNNLFFSLSTYFVMPFWVLIIFLPRWKWTKRIMDVPFFVAILTLLYVILAIPQMGVLLPLLTRPSVARAMALLGTPEGATIGWIHMVAFDLFVGRWIYFDSQQRRISAWFVSPLLFVTFMLGPLGFLCYFCLRTVFALVRRNAGNVAKRSKPVMTT